MRAPAGTLTDLHMLRRKLAELTMQSEIAASSAPASLRASSTGARSVPLPDYTARRAASATQLCFEGLPVSVDLAAMAAPLASIARTSAPGTRAPPPHALRYSEPGVASRVCEAPTVVGPASGKLLRFSGDNRVRLLATQAPPASA